MTYQSPAPEHGITATGMYVVTEKMLQKIELESGVLLDSLRSRPAQQPEHHPINPCEENGCTDWENCDEICSLHPDLQKQPEPRCRHWYPEKRDGVSLYECHAKQQPDALAEAYRMIESLIYSDCPPEDMCDPVCEKSCTECKEHALACLRGERK